MDWYRAYHGLCTDPKLHRLARSINVSRGLVIAGWHAVLETASAATQRGCVGHLDPVSLAFMIDVKPHVGAKIMGGFQAAGMLDEAGNVVAWERRQRASDDSAVRKRKFRERAAEANALENKETAPVCHGTNPQVEQNRTDKKEEKRTPIGVPKEKPEPRGSRISPDWQPTETDIAFALNAGMTHDDVRRESAKFLDYWLGAAGPKSRKSDWAACWRTWTRNAIERGGFALRPGSNGSGGGGNRRADSRQTGRLADTLAVLHRRGSLEGLGVH